MNELQRYKLGYYVLAGQAAVLLYQNYRLVRKLQKEREKTTRIVTYFGEVLNRNEVPIDEFDLLALRAMGVIVRLKEKED